MVGPIVAVLSVLVLLGGSQVRAVEMPKIDGLTPGGRFEYRLLLDDQSNPYTRNAATHSATDRSRLMLDLKALGSRYGDLYLKGAAAWGLVDADETQRRFRFEQGDYLWKQEFERFGYSLRFFANERRFFVSDLAAPLIDDDRAGETGANRGVRFEAATQNGWSFSGIHSFLGDDFDDSRNVSYLRAAFSHRLASLSASYLFDDPGVRGERNRAIVKAELVTGYKNVFAVLAYEQSGMRDSGWFFPNGSWNWSDYNGSNFSRVLPPGGAAVAELRLTSLRWKDVGRFRVVWSYEAIREEFVNDLGLGGSSRVGHNAGAYFVADKVSLNGKVRYHTSTRFGPESEELDFVDASVWAALKNNIECFLRAGVGKIDDAFVFDTKENFVHTALEYRVKKFRTGAHIMWKDLDTVFSEKRFAWDGKLAINPDWGFHWRFILRRDFQIGQSACLRLQFRPNDRVFAYVGYGRAYFGDDPFVLEDRDIGLTRAGAAQWVIALRGDF
ncbi:MAG: hypothetical protein JSW58_06785 [Candidatus Latescibacterota bacterium]|nr:MAG: hypothetical protein JSW58_06785 [Candidatus Latescibacterota bacterium]